MYTRRRCESTLFFFSVPHHTHHTHHTPHTPLSSLLHTATQHNTTQNTSQRSKEKMKEKMKEKKKEKMKEKMTEKREEKKRDRDEERDKNEKRDERRERERDIMRRHRELKKCLRTSKSARRIVSYSFVSSESYPCFQLFQHSLKQRERSIGNRLNRKLHGPTLQGKPCIGVACGRNQCRSLARRCVLCTHTLNSTENTDRRTEEPKNRTTKQFCVAAFFVVWGVALPCCHLRCRPLPFSVGAFVRGLTQGPIFSTS